MKATIEFNLPEDEHEHRICMDAPRVRLAVSELLIDLRNWKKHGHDFQTPDAVIFHIQQDLLEKLPGDML